MCSSKKIFWMNFPIKIVFSQTQYTLLCWMRLANSDMRKSPSSTLATDILEKSYLRMFLNMFLDHNIVFTKFLTFSEIPEHVWTVKIIFNGNISGKVLVVVPMPQGGATEGWQDVGDGQMAAQMSRFLQRDVNEGRIWYQHGGNTSKSDFFMFEVTRSL